MTQAHVIGCSVSTAKFGDVQQFADAWLDYGERMHRKAVLWMISGKHDMFQLEQASREMSPASTEPYEEIKWR